ncbi:MAG: acyl carrier protein [Bacteroidales bacterium]|nr:acyl carrier protein [Bacteroidales bacterium]
MEKSEIQSKVFEIVAGVCETTPDQINDNTTIGDFPQWDSVGQLTILSSVEEAFEINFEPEEMMEIEDVKDIVNAVEVKL